MSSSLSSSSGGPLFDPAAARLRASMTAAFAAAPDREAGLEDLRGAVCDYARQQRESGVRAEEVIIAVKHLIEASDLRRALPREYRELSERIVTWCIGDYYRAD
jgi:hypothetical protein